MRQVNCVNNAIIHSVTAQGIVKPIGLSNTGALLTSDSPDLTWVYVKQIYNGALGQSTGFTYTPVNGAKGSWLIGSIAVRNNTVTAYPALLGLAININCPSNPSGNYYVYRPYTVPASDTFYFEFNLQLPVLDPVYSEPVTVDVRNVVSLTGVPANMVSILIARYAYLY